MAAQTLSNSVAQALLFLSDDLKMKEFKGCHATVKFIETIDKVFDLTNSRLPFGRGYKCPLKEENCAFWLPFLHEAIEYLKSIKTLAGDLICLTNRKTPFIGFVVSLMSINNIYKFFILEKKYLSYLLTYKFSQDHIELFFCAIR